MNTDSKNAAEMSKGWKCSTCGQSHAGIPLSFAADFPDMYANMKREERDVRAQIGSDQCIIDGEWFFIRGCLEIPIISSDEIFLWGLWASVREEVYDEIGECWTLEGREKTHGPFKGRLNNSLRMYPETLNLKLEIALQPVGARPLFKVEETGHPLGAEQRDGITRTRAMELAALLLHG
ncbi:MAG TPA: DUF2199 domain-containing protein [Terriglobales bacterium]|nr:DUF2199 domain-containing protein [Terriglobales bacterium]